MFALTSPGRLWPPAGRSHDPALRLEAAALRPALRGLIARLLGHGVEHPDVEDATQEALRRVLEGAPNLATGVPLRPWAFGVARHVALDLLRARRRSALRLQDDDALLHLPDDAPSPEAAALQRQRSAAAQDALLQLPDGMRQALLLFHGEGLSYLQIAEKMSLPVGTVATWITRARKHLSASCLEPKEPLSMELLGRELLLDPDGHLSEIGAGALADGQDALIPADLLAHAASCPECQLRLGQQALQVELVHRALGADPAPALASTRAPALPWRSLLIAAALAALGAAPTLLAPETAASARTLLRMAPALLLALGRALQEPDMTTRMATMSWAGALVLALVGAALARLATRQHPQGDPR